MLARLAEHGLIKGERMGIDASTMEANAALRTIVRRDNGETYRDMATRMAVESGVETPTAEDLVRLDRNRKGKKLSNADWASPADPDARIAKMKDGRTHLAYKPEHAMDLDTGAVVGAELHPADQGDTTTMPGTLASAAEHLAAVDTAPTPAAPAELIADKGYHSRDGLKALDGGPWKSRISEPQRDEFSRWHGDDAARRAVYNNRARLLSGVARQAFKLRAELVERGFALILDRGGMRRVWLRGRENVRKCYLIHVAGYNLGLIMRLLDRGGNATGVLRLSFHPAVRDPESSCWLSPVINPPCLPSESDQTRSAENTICNELLSPAGLCGVAHRRGNLIGDNGSSCLHWISSQMRIPGSSLRLAVSQKLAKDRQPHPA